jgi:hypothetical protein
MSPIDDELRAALRGRAQVLAPSPDPMAGIEARAKRLQRNRIGVAMAGSALAVAAVAAVVPALQSTSTQPAPPNVASAEPSSAPVLETTGFALDPAAPWDYRGDRELAVQGDVDAYTVQWSAQHRLLTDEVELVPLFGHRDRSGTPEVVYLATVTATGERWWGVAHATESGPELRVDQRLPQRALALAAALPDDRLLVVASPAVGGLSYGPDAGSEYSAMQELAAGVAQVDLAGEAATDSYRVVDRQGRELHRAPAPDPVQAPVDEAQPPTALDPAQPWAVRGDPSLVTSGQLDALGEDWAQRHGLPGAQVTPLYVQRYEVDAGLEVVYLVRSGDGPWSWGVSTLGEGGWSWYADNPLAGTTTALAAALPGDEGAERLLVVGAPSLGGAVYAADGRSYEPMTDLGPGVFIGPVAPGDADDRFKVLDGDGDLDDPVFEGPAPNFQNAG